MAIKQRYNNSQERLEDNAEKAILPMLEKQFIYELGLRPTLSLEYVSELSICKVDVTFHRLGGKFSIAYNDHRQPISYPRYTTDQMSRLIHTVAQKVVEAIQDKVNTYGTSDVRGYATQLYHQCLEDEETFMTWIEQCRPPKSVKDELLRYASENRHHLADGLRGDSTSCAFAVLASTFSTDYLQDMTEKEISDIVEVVGCMLRLQEVQ